MSRRIFTKNTSYFFRGVAILMVAFSHYCEFMPESGLRTFLVGMGDPGVGIFFLLSGYGLWVSYNNKKTDAKYLIRRLQSFYIPYILIASFIVIWSREPFGLKDLYVLLTGKNYWFITVLLLIYLAFFLIGRIPVKNSVLKILFMALFVSGISIWFWHEKYGIFWYDANWCFVVGMLIAYVEEIVVGKRSLQKEMPPTENKNGCKPFEIKDYVLCFLGKYSLYIYMLHSFVFYRFVDRFPEKLQNNGLYLLMFLAFTVSVIVSAILDWVLKRIYSIKEWRLL